MLHCTCTHSLLLLKHSILLPMHRCLNASFYEWLIQHHPCLPWQALIMCFVTMATPNHTIGDMCAIEKLKTVKSYVCMHKMQPNNNNHNVCLVSSISNHSSNKQPQKAPVKNYIELYSHM